MDNIVFVEFTSVNKRGVEQSSFPIQDIKMFGRTKNGCCFQTSDGLVYDAINVYDDAKKVLVANGIKFIDLPVPKLED